MNDNVIVHCSRQLAQLLSLNLDSETDLADFALHVDDGRIAAGCERLGLPANWLASHICGSNGATHPSLDIPATDGTTFRVNKTPVLDDNGRPIGRLLIIRAEFPSTLPRSVWHRAVEAKQELSTLSARESEILGFVASGLTNKAAAQRAHISEKTVEKHRANIMRKLGVRSVADLIRRVTEANLLAEV
jgi:DNA-binding CsgD family transcriptional regulator